MLYQLAQRKEGADDISNKRLKKRNWEMVMKPLVLAVLHLLMLLHMVCSLLYMGTDMDVCVHVFPPIIDNLSKPVWEHLQTKWTKAKDVCCL